MNAKLPASQRAYLDSTTYTDIPRVISRTPLASCVLHTATHRRCYHAPPLVLHTTKCTTQTYIYWRSRIFHVPAAGASPSVLNNNVVVDRALRLVDHDHITKSLSNN